GHERLYFLLMTLTAGVQPVQFLLPRDSFRRRHRPSPAGHRYRLVAGRRDRAGPVWTWNPAGFQCAQILVHPVPFFVDFEGCVALVHFTPPFDGRRRSFSSAKEPASAPADSVRP